jgi:hypothetical protein
MSDFMVATVILGMLCVHLLCFCVLFMLISRRLPGRKMGMEVFALGNLLLGCAYILQLLGGKPGWSVMSLVNHTLTLCAGSVCAGRDAVFQSADAGMASAADSGTGLQRGSGAGAVYAGSGGASGHVGCGMCFAVSLHDDHFALGNAQLCQEYGRGDGGVCHSDRGICILNAMKFVLILKAACRLWT